MFTPYLWKQLCRKMPGILLVPLMGLAAGCLLCVIHGSELKNAREVAAVYDRIDVPCTVTNLTGTQSDGLNLPIWVTDLFFADENPEASPQELAFSSLFRDPWAKATLRADLNGTNISLVGITGLEADKALRPENGCEITWLEPYGEEILKTDQLVCLVPQELWETLNEAADGSRLLALNVLGGFGRPDPRTTLPKTPFTVAGTYLGGSGAIYCPWAAVRSLSLSLDGYYMADDAGAVIRNNRELDSFWDSAAGEFFVPPNPDGTQVPWEKSGPYQYYPFALFINDSTFRQTIALLERNQYILHILSLAVLLLALAAGFMTSFLLLHRRERELALQYVLGVSKRIMVQSALMEQLLLLSTGLALSAAGYFVLVETVPPWTHLGIYLVSDGLGAAIAMGFFLSRDMTVVLKGE